MRFITEDTGDEKWWYARRCQSLSAGISHRASASLICCLSSTLADKCITRSRNTHTNAHAHTRLIWNTFALAHAPFSPWKRDVQFPSLLSGQLVSFRKQAVNKALLVDGFSVAHPVNSSSDRRETEVICATLCKTHGADQLSRFLSVLSFSHHNSGPVIFLKVTPHPPKKENGCKRKIEVVISSEYRGHSLNIWCRRIGVHSSGTN